MAKRKIPPHDVARKVLHDVGRDIDQTTVDTAMLSAERIAQAYKNLFTGEDGAIVLADLKHKFNGTTVRIRPAGIDPHEVIYREGQRSLYLALCEAQVPPVPITHDEEIEI